MDLLLRSAEEICGVSRALRERSQSLCLTARVLATRFGRRIAGGSDSPEPARQPRDGYGDVVCPHCHEAVRPWQSAIMLRDRQIAHGHCPATAAPEARPAA